MMISYHRRSCHAPLSNISPPGHGEWTNSCQHQVASILKPSWILCFPQRWRKVCSHRKLGPIAPLFSSCLRPKFWWQEANLAWIFLDMMVLLLEMKWRLKLVILLLAVKMLQVGPVGRHLLHRRWWEPEMGTKKSLSYTVKALTFKNKLKS